VSTGHPRVAIDVTPLIGARTGVGVAVAEILRALQAITEAPVIVPYTLSARARLHRTDVPDDTRFVPLPARTLLHSWARRDSPSIDAWLSHADVVHATNYVAPPSRVPVLVSVYDCSFIRYPELCTPQVRAFEPILRRAIARGATVHTGSAFVADEIEENFGAGLRAQGRLAVVPLGVPELGAQSALPAELAGRLDGAPFVLAIGTLEPRKNYPHLVGAFGELAARHPSLRLVIAGQEGPARPGVDRAVARLQQDARDRAIVTGAVDDAGRRALLEQAAVLAYPSIYEGFGFPVLEAMSVGAPVVAARAGSIPEVAGNAALLVEPTDEHALASAIERVLTEDATRAELIARGRDRVRAFSWDHAAVQLAGWYRRIADQ
jgi:glycosyltransferase involved in cell wall biosynthesis